MSKRQAITALVVLLIFQFAAPCPQPIHDIVGALLALFLFGVLAIDVIRAIDRWRLLWR